MKNLTDYISEGLNYDNNKWMYGSDKYPSKEEFKLIKQELKERAKKVKKWLKIINKHSKNGMVFTSNLLAEYINKNALKNIPSIVTDGVNHTFGLYGDKLCTIQTCTTNKYETFEFMGINGDPEHSVYCDGSTWYVCKYPFNNSQEITYNTKIIINASPYSTGVKMEDRQLSLGFFYQLFSRFDRFEKEFENLLK